MQAFVSDVRAFLIAAFALLSAAIFYSAPSLHQQTEWTMLQTGLETALIPLPNTPVHLFVVRIDPTYFTFRVQYRPGAPLDRVGWQRATPGAVAFINANYFDAAYQARGLLVIDGETFGSAIEARGGLLQAAGGEVRIRSLIREPYRGEAEALDQAVQGYPLLVVEGIGTYAVHETLDQVARRSVAARDRQGRILLLAAAGVGVSLSDLSQNLPKTDLEIVNAVNLDGGTSTLLHVGIGYAVTDIDSAAPVPAILAVYPQPEGVLCLDESGRCYHQ